MGTNFKEGQKPKNRITISKSGADSAAPRKIDPDTGVVDRSFAQPSPVKPPREVEPKAHASVEDEVEALNENSTEGRTYQREEDDDDDEKQDNG